MGTLKEMLFESVLVQGVITVSVIGLYGYMLVSGQEVPETLIGLVGTVVGFFFGGKFSQNMAKLGGK